MKSNRTPLDVAKRALLLIRNRLCRFSSCSCGYNQTTVENALTKIRRMEKKT